MKKIALILISFLLLTGCINNGKLVMDNGEGKGGQKIENQKLQEISSGDYKDKHILGGDLGDKKQKRYDKVVSGFVNNFKEDNFSVIKKELDREFRYIYLPTDSNHYETGCYLLLDVDYKKKQFVLYRIKGALVLTGGCKLNGVEKIGVLWYHNGKPDSKGEYVLKSYDKETGLFKYVMSEKYGNLGTGKNEYEFRFYLTGGRVIKERFDDNSLLKLFGNRHFHFNFSSWYLHLKCIWGSFDFDEFYNTLRKVGIKDLQLKVVNMEMGCGPIPCYNFKDSDKIVVVQYSGDVINFYGIDYKVYLSREYIHIIKPGDIYLIKSKYVNVRQCEKLFAYKGVEIYFCKVDDIAVLGYKKDKKFTILDVQLTDRKPFVTGLGDYIVYVIHRYDNKEYVKDYIYYFNVNTNKRGMLLNLEDDIIITDCFSEEIRIMGVIGNKYLYIREVGGEYEMGGWDDLLIYALVGDKFKQIYHKDFFSEPNLDLKDIYYDKLDDSLVVKYVLSGEDKVLKITKEFLDELLEKYLLADIVTEKCGIKKFDISKIPTESGESIDLTCNGFGASLLYSGNSEYVLSIEGFREPIYYIYIKDGKVTKEGYNICGKWFNTLEEFYNLTGELPVGDLWDNKCKFIDISSGFKYSGYYVAGKFLTDIYGGEEFNYKPIWTFYIGNDRNLELECDEHFCKDLFRNIKIKVKIKKFDKGFLLYTLDGKLLKIKRPVDVDASWYSIYKTFLNGKEVK